MTNTSIALLFLGFTVGFLLCLLIAVFITYRAVRKVLNERSYSIDSSKSEKVDTQQQRMQRVKDITAEQLDLARQADGPQRNALDGKHKNIINRRLKALDDEKVKILESMLADGHDPELTTVDESGVVTNMKLSEYMAYTGIKTAKKDPPKTTTHKQIGKFTVVKGGKDDGGGETTH